MEFQRHFFLLFVLCSSFLCSSQAYKFYVGGTDGWVLNPSQSYNNWAAKKRFQVNDVLVFKYKKGSDSVLVVNQDDYNSCNKKNPIKKLEDGDSEFSFDKSGPFYFISGKDQNCEKGQKLIVVVLAVRHYGQYPPTSAPTPISPSPKSSSPAPALAPKPLAPVPAAPKGSPVPAPRSHGLVPAAPTRSPVPAPRSHGLVPATSPSSISFPPAWSPASTSPAATQPSVSPPLAPSPEAYTPAISPGSPSPAATVPEAYTPAISPASQSPAGSPASSSPVATPQSSPPSPPEPTTPSPSPSTAPSTPTNGPGTPSGNDTVPAASQSSAWALNPTNVLVGSATLLLGVALSTGTLGAF
ncbi:early nodulin-like protein 4 [Alnus glutinosa]|uniref:early nodulin-like protein 4 n=1 Tax=Alnus glutinosa TaxID=3517 RepID=UPI002D782A35|nr:early nodulin-like protein 4 [Alnus glutinosa]